MDIKKFLKKLLALSLLIFVLDKALAFWATQAVLHDSRGFGSRSLLYRGTVDYQIVLLGSSKTYINIDAGAIEQKTGLTCLNLGNNSGSLDMCEFLLDEVVSKSTKPKIIFVEADFDQIRENSPHKFHASLIAPFSNVSAHVSKRLNPTPADQFAFWFFRCKNFSAGDGIGGLLRSMIKYACHVVKGSGNDSGNADNLTSQSATVAGDIGSYRSRYSNGSALMAPREKEVIKEDNVGQGYTISSRWQAVYLRIIDRTKSEKVRLVLYGPPFFGALNEEVAQEMDQFFLQLEEQNGHVHYWSFRDNNDLGSDVTLWNDSIHLNWDGAEILTQKIVEKLETLQD